MMACRYDHPEIVSVLLEHGASVSSRDSGGEVSLSASRVEVFCSECF
jgi:ankyrin repeat protein